MARTGGAVNTLLTDEGLGTKVIGHNRLANLSVRLVSNEDNQIKRGITFILNLSTQIKMKESTMEQAKLLFSKIVKEKVIRHKSMEAKVAAVLLAAHRMTNCSRPLKDIMIATGVKKKRDISHCYNAIRRLIPQEKHDEQVSDLVERLCGRFNLSGEHAEVAKQMATTVVLKDVLAGKYPMSIAAACVFIVMKRTTKPIDISSMVVKSGITENTITNAAKIILAYKDEVFPAWWCAAVPVSRVSIP